MDKNCGGDWINCGHSAQSGTGINCKYMGYCDFQLPRDSRNLDINLGTNDCNCGCATYILSGGLHLCTNCHQIKR